MPGIRQALKYHLTGMEGEMRLKNGPERTNSKKLNLLSTYSRLPYCFCQIKNLEKEKVFFITRNKWGKGQELSKHKKASTSHADKLKRQSGRIQL